MTMKTKRRLAVCSGTTLCAALALLIAMRFSPEDEQQFTASAPETSSVSTANTTNKENPQSLDNNEESDSADSESNTDPQTEINPDDLIESVVSEVKQDFPEPDTEQGDPPNPPKTEDEFTPANPNTEPTYTPEQPKPKLPSATTTPTTTSNTPKHGDTKDGMIYITGFGWIKDEGGGGRGEDESDMYENGNKIGYFG